VVLPDDAERLGGQEALREELAAAKEAAERYRKYELSWERETRRLERVVAVTEDALRAAKNLHAAVITRSGGEQIAAQKFGEALTRVAEPTDERMGISTFDVPASVFGGGGSAGEALSRVAATEEAT
jgi:hypothetical protein